MNTRSMIRRARLAAAMLLLACPASAGRPRPDIDRAMGQNIAFATVQRGAYGAWARPVLMVAGGECEWTSAMAALASRGELIAHAAPEAPTVSWSRQTVALVALGRADGYSVEVRGVSRIGRRLVLDVHVEQAPPTGLLDVSPFHLVVVNSKQIDEITARYDWAFPGLPARSAAASCGVAPPSVLRLPAARNASATEAAETDARVADPTPAVTSWGSLKRRFR